MTSYNYDVMAQLSFWRFRMVKLDVGCNPSKNQDNWATNMGDSRGGRIPPPPGRLRNFQTLVRIGLNMAQNICDAKVHIVTLPDIFVFDLQR